MNKGLIYLIQPAELIGTERYKIGMSNNPNLDRCKNGYKKGSRYLCIMECDNALILENKIKKHFNEKFKLLAGNEYYEGNEKDILNTFNNLVIEYSNSFNINKSLDNLNNNIDIEELDLDIHNFNEIKEEFENYKEDIQFGGTKQLIKVYINQHHIGDYNKREDYTINFKYIYDKKLEECDLYINDINLYCFNYIKKIIDKKIIQNGYIYDLNNNVFQKKINKYKKIYNNVIFSKKTNDIIIKYQQQYNPLKKNTITYLFKIDYLINNIPCCSYYNEHSFTLYPHHSSDEFKIYELNEKYYDYLYLRNNIPYCIEFNKITKNYYVINRDYEYIGYDNIKCLKDIENDIDVNQCDWGWSRIYLFNDGNKPWINKINFKNYLKKYNQEKINNSLNILKNNNIDYDLFEL